MKVHLSFPNNHVLQSADFPTLLGKHRQYVVPARNRTNDLAVDIEDEVEELAACDCVIAKLSPPSLDVAWEMGVAHATSIPIIGWIEEGEAPSSGLAGWSMICVAVKFEDIRTALDLAEKMDKAQDNREYIRLYHQLQGVGVRR